MTTYVVNEDKYGADFNLTPSGQQVSVRIKKNGVVTDEVYYVVSVSYGTTYHRDYELDELITKLTGSDVTLRKFDKGSLSFARTADPADKDIFLRIRVGDPLPLA